jgi:hypothetical protein
MREPPKGIRRSESDETGKHDEVGRGQTKPVVSMAGLKIVVQKAKVF